MSKANSNQNHVFESNATYYNPVSKKWKEGTFTLNKTHFQFITNDDEQFHLSFPLNTISSIEKKQSTFIYAALVVTIGSEKHWFASFPNRDAVFNIFELFWREHLLSKSYSTKSRTEKEITRPTVLGKELLNILHDSENTLVGAANALSEQGQQLEDAQEIIQGINSDLTIAEKFIKTMSSLPIISAKKSNINSELNTNSKDEVKKDLEERLKRFKVTFTFSKFENKENWEQGMLVISNEVILLDDQGNTKLNIPSSELHSFQVLSPWELGIVVKSDDEIRHFCYIMCPQLTRMLKFISSLSTLKEKIIYDKDDTSFYETASCSSSCSSMVSAPSSPMSSSAQKPLCENQEFLQQKQNNELVSEEEVQEITNILSNLQTLAVEVGREQQNQMEKINALISGVDSTELRINSDNKKIKKLM